MKRTHALLAVAIGTALIVGATAFAASGEATALKQRIAIDIVRNKVTGTKPDNGTFTLYAVDEFAGRPGALETDEGTMTIPGGGGGSTLRNGMKVWAWEQGVDLKGRHGTLAIRVRGDSNDMQNGVRVEVGTWKIVKGTGAYAGFKGGGRHVSVRMPNGRTIVRQEGWVTG